MALEGGNNFINDLRVYRAGCIHHLGDSHGFLIPGSALGSLVFEGRAAQCSLPARAEALAGG